MFDLDSNLLNVLSIYECFSLLFIFTASTPLRKDTGVFESFDRFYTSCFIGSKCRNYALNLCFIYKISITLKT